MDSSFSSNCGRNDSNTPNNLARVGGIVENISSSARAVASSKRKELTQAFSKKVEKVKENISDDYRQQEERKDIQKKSEEKKFLEDMQEFQEGNN